MAFTFNPFKALSEIKSNRAATDQANFAADINQIRLLRGTQSPAAVATPPPTAGTSPVSRPATYGNNAATSPARNQFVNNQLNAYKYEDDPTVYGNYQGNPDFAFSSAEQFKGAGGDFGQVQVRQRPTATGGTTTTETATVEAPVDPYAKYNKAIEDYIASLAPSSDVTSAKQKYLDYVNSAQSGINALEGQGRGIPLQLVRGQQEKLGKQAELTAQRLQQDIGLAQDFQSATQNQLKTRADFEESLLSQNKPLQLSSGEALVKYNPKTGKYEEQYQAPFKPAEVNLPASAEEYLFAVQNGYKGSYNDYQDMDANRKRSIVNVNTGTGLNPYQTFQAINTIQDNARQDKDISLFPDVRGAYEQARQAAAQKNSLGDIVLMRTIAKITDPSSAVREEEFATFKSAIGTLPRYGIALTSNLVGKGQLTDAGRQAIMGQITNIYNQRQAAYQNKVDYYNNQAAPYGGNIPSYSAPSGNDPLGLGL